MKLRDRYLEVVDVSVLSRHILGNSLGVDGDELASLLNLTSTR